MVSLKKNISFWKKVFKKKPSPSARPPRNSRIFWALLVICAAFLAVLALRFQTQKNHPAPTSAPMRVMSQQITPGQAHQALEFHGHTRPSASVELMAQISSRVEKIMASNGAFVKKGDTLIQLAEEARAARLAQMQARVAHYELDVDASKSLVKKAHQSQNQANKLLADLKQAQADAIAAQMDWEHTRIHAPFDGIFVKGAIDEGSFANVGSNLGRLVNLSPLRIVVYVGEQEYPLLQLGQECHVLLPQGGKGMAKITFKSPVTTNKTHTFEVHLEMDNPNGLPEGMAVTVLAQTSHNLATTLPASLLTLNDEGSMGVKIIDSENKVRFIHLTLLSSNPEHVIVSGLTEPVRIITRGQEFVNEGQVVSFEDETPLSPENTSNPPLPPTSQAP